MRQETTQDNSSMKVRIIKIIENLAVESMGVDYNINY